MKNFKKLTAAIAATLMAATMVAPMAMNFVSSAAEATKKITVTATENQTFEAYQLMTAEHSGTNYKYTVNPDYRAAMADALKISTTSATDDEVDAAIITELEKIVDDSDIRAFADAVYVALKNDGVTADVKEIAGGTAKNVEEGYYLIYETTAGSALAEGEARTKVIVNTADSDDGITVSLKKAGPSVEKKIWDTDDSTDANNAIPADLSTLEGWQDSADHDITDQVPFKLTATLPSDLTAYDDYYVQFNDILDSSFTLNRTSIQVMIDGVNVTNQFTIATTDDGFTVTSLNVKGIVADGVSIGDSEVIDVYYTAELNENAVIGREGNWNKVNLEYTNDYYWTGDGTNGPNDKDKSKTTDDFVVAYTYKTVIDKVNQQSAALGGASFTLYKYDADEADYVKVKDYDMDAVAGTKTVFEFKGLDAGQYKLVETVVPTGYTKAEDVEFEITATHSDEVTNYKPHTVQGSEEYYLTEFDVEGVTDWTADLVGGEVTHIGNTDSSVSGEVYAKVENRSGSKLPSTGGIGTTLFYIGGGTMVAVAGIFLITKKRMSKNEA